MNYTREAMRVYRNELRATRKLLGACRDCGKLLPGPNPGARCAEHASKARGHQRKRATRDVQLRRARRAAERIGE